ncbi:MAG: rRNA maturation RNase YbeY [Bacteroidales bacterium]
MAINFINQDVELKFNENKNNIKKWINEIIHSESKLSSTITYIFCDDNYLLDLNKKFLNHDYLTDVITFDYTENDNISGDIFISIDRVKENAEFYKINFFCELYRVMIHGILHLCGYEDSSSTLQKKMREKENNYLLFFPTYVN